MASRPEMLDNMDFDQQMKEMDDRRLLEFLARDAYEKADMYKQYEDRLKGLEKGDRRAAGITGGVSGTITGVVIGIINYLLNRG